MSQHQLPASHARRERFPFAILRSLAAAAALAAGAAAGPAAESADPAPPAALAVSDVWLARTALAALDSEPDLRGANLVVSVVDRVAVVGGPVPSAAASKKVEQVIRKVEGIKDVRNTCFVNAATAPDPLLKAVADRMGSSLPKRPVMAELPGVLSPQPAPVSPFPAAVPPDTNIAAADPARATVVTRSIPPVAGAVGLLGAPVGPAGSGLTAPPVAPQPTAPGLLTATVPVAPTDLLAAAGEARRADPRFAHLTVDLRAGTLVIGGSAPLAADAWDFAQKLRSIPGASRVAVGAVSGK